MTTINFNQVKSTLSSTLQACNLNENLINELLTDDFINGLLELKSQEPENNEFITLVKNFSNEQNLSYAINFEKKFRQELSQEGYVSNVFQYIMDSWKNINFSMFSRIKSQNNGSVEGTKEIISIIATGIDFIADKFNAGVGVYASQLGTYLDIAEATHNNQKKIYNVVDSMTEELESLVRPRLQTASDAKSPLIIDLDGDGVETVGKESGVYFDHDGNGFAENTGWAGKDDGILVRDLDGDGAIDKGTELFGNNSVLASGEKAANGFEALAELDSNADGIFNASDATWNEVKVWKDANQNGLVDSGELLTLEQSGVGGINLGYTDSNTTDANGNTHGETGTIIKTDGTTGAITDVWFDANMSNTVDRTDVVIPDAIKSLPNVSGFGNVHSLQIAHGICYANEIAA